MSQFAFELAHAPVYREENFVVSACNRAAHEWVLRWPNWPAHALLVYGPSGSGKTHLGHIWAGRAKAAATPVDAASLKSHALIEQIETMEEKTLLHLLNAAKENRFSLLLTANVAARELPFKLPDLTSRLLALPAVAIDAPDDDVLMAALRKQFSDRQLMVDDEVLHYVMPRIERSFAAIRSTVEALDKQALAEKKNITVPFVKRVLGY